jgi:hypothetical protein
MARVQHLSDEDHAMKVTCYLIWGLAIAVFRSIGVRDLSVTGLPESTCSR